MDNRAKIAYIACHGKRRSISAVKDISRTKLKNIVAPLTSYDGLFFGACDFANRRTAQENVRRLELAIAPPGLAPVDALSPERGSLASAEEN